jgi:hypothetical protein
MLKPIIAAIFLVVVLVAAGIAFSACFGSQAIDGTTVTQEGTPVRTPIPGSPPPISPSPPPSPGPTASPTPTLEPGVCPPPYRRVAAVPEMLGGRMEGDTSYQQGYLTLHLPAGREFIVSSGVSGEGLSFAVYDVGTQSVLHIRGDGCELGRIMGDVAGDAVFDEIVAALEVGSSYVCSSQQRSVLAPEEIPPDPSRLGQRVTAGAAQAERLGLHLPPGREFVVWQGLADPGGGFTGIYDIAAQSFLFLGADGCEMSRRITDPAADSVFDEIVGAQQVPTRGALGCADRWVQARDQLDVTAEDMRLGKDGKYYVPDRGDGCAYEQDTSSSWGLVLRAPCCEMFWVQVSEPGELKPVIP